MLIIRNSSIHVKCEGCEWVRMVESDDVGLRPYFPLLSLFLLYMQYFQCFLWNFGHGTFKLWVYCVFFPVQLILCFVFAKRQGKRKKKKEQHLERKRHSSKEEVAQRRPVSTKQEAAAPKVLQNGGPPPGYRWAVGSEQCCVLVVLCLVLFYLVIYFSCLQAHCLVALKLALVCPTYSTRLYLKAEYVSAKFSL